MYIQFQNQNKMKKIIILLGAAFLFSCQSNIDKYSTADGGDLPNGWTEEQKEEFTQAAYKERKTGEYTAKDVKKYAECFFEALAQEVTYKEWKKASDEEDSEEETSEKMRRKKKKISGLEDDCITALRKKGRENDEYQAAWTSKQQKDAIDFVTMNCVNEGYDETRSKVYAKCCVESVKNKMSYDDFMHSGDAAITTLWNKTTKSCAGYLQ
jgi:hypothetical protein